MRQNRSHENQRNLVEIENVANPSKHTVKRRGKIAFPSELLCNGAHLLERGLFPISHLTKCSNRCLSFDEV